MALGEGHDSLFHVGLDAACAFEKLSLALADKRIDGCNLDIEKPLNRGLDLRLCRGLADLEQDLVCFRRHGRLFGDDRGDNHVVTMRVMRKFCRAHLKRASNASMAALVKTSFSRRRMS